MKTYQIRFTLTNGVENFTDRAAFLRRQLELQDWSIRFSVSVVTL